MVEPIDAGHCAVTIGGDSYETVAALIVHAGLEFTLLERLLRDESAADGR